MKAYPLAIHMAGKDLDAARQYLRLALSTTDHAAQILREAKDDDLDLEYSSDQAEALRREIAGVVDAAEGIDAQSLKDYVGAQAVPA